MAISLSLRGNSRPHWSRLRLRDRLPLRHAVRVTVRPMGSIQACDTAVPTSFGTCCCLPFYRRMVHCKKMDHNDVPYPWRNKKPHAMGFGETEPVEYGTHSWLPGPIWSRRADPGSREYSVILPGYSQGFAAMKAFQPLRTGR